MLEAGLASPFCKTGLSYLIECYEIVLGISNNLNFGDLFERSKSQRTRANHGYKAKINAYKYSVCVRIKIYFCIVM